MKESKAMKEQRWQFLITNSILGPILVGARRNGRGPWLGGQTWKNFEEMYPNAPIPQYVIDYLGFTERNGRRVLFCSESIEEYRDNCKDAVQWQKAGPGMLKGFCWIPAPEKKPKPKPIPKRIPAIRNLQDLCDHFGADSPQDLNHRIYKDTGCGASISVQTPDGKWHHNGEDWTDIQEIQSFSIQTIVEGSDAEVNGPDFVLPVTQQEVDDWIEEMEMLASTLWEEANQWDEEVDEDCDISKPELTA